MTFKTVKVGAPGNPRSGSPPSKTPAGRDKRRLYSTNESSTAWPKYGQVDFAASVGKGRHYSVASPEWADKPYGFANFLRSARFVNSLYNGRVLSQRASAEGGFRYVTYRVRLSRLTESGMYDMTNRKATRSHEIGFVVPSQDEWIKAAYFDPNGGGKYSYWKYPTNPGCSKPKTKRRARRSRRRSTRRPAT